MPQKEFLVEYTIENKGRYASSTSGWTNIILNGNSIFEKKDKTEEVRGFHGTPFFSLAWFINLLPEHLSSKTSPQGNYISGIDVYNQYKLSFAVPRNIPHFPNPNPKIEREAKFGKSRVKLTDFVDPFDLWMDIHLMPRSVPYAPEICIQRWPHAKDYVEISWDFSSKKYKKPKGRVLVTAEEYQNEIIHSSRIGLAQLKKLNDFRIEELEKTLQKYSLLKNRGNMRET